MKQTGSFLLSVSLEEGTSHFLSRWLVSAFCQRHCWCTGYLLIARVLRAHPKVCISFRRSFHCFGENSLCWGLPLLAHCTSHSTWRLSAEHVQLWVICCFTFAFFSISFSTTSDTLYNDFDGFLIMNILSIAVWYTRIAIDAPVLLPRSSKERSNESDLMNEMPCRILLSVGPSCSSMYLHCRH